MINRDYISDDNANIDGYCTQNDMTSVFVIFEGDSEKLYVEGYIGYYRGYLEHWQWELGPLR